MLLYNYLPPTEDTPLWLFERSFPSVPLMESLFAVWPYAPLARIAACRKPNGRWELPWMGFPGSARQATFWAPWLTGGVISGNRETNVFGRTRRVRSSANRFPC